MDLEIVLSLIALFLSMINTFYLIIRFILSKAPILEYNFLENIRPNEVRFYLRNIGEIKGKLTELKMFDSIKNQYVDLLIELDLQNLYPKERTPRNFKFKYDVICKELKTKWVELEFIAKIKVKILFFSKEYPYYRTHTVQC